MTDNPKKVYKPGEKIPMTEEMVGFLCMLRAKERYRELKFVAYDDCRGKHHKILY